MNTEISELKNEVAWILYDGDCSLCLAMVERLRPLLLHYQFGIAPLQAPWVRDRLGATADTPITEMALLTPQGEHYGGADAILKSADYIWWARPFARLATMMGFLPALRLVYRHIAARRHCWNGACELRAVRTSPSQISRHGAKWLPALALPILAILTTTGSPRWLVMWATAFSIWLGCKWLTLWQARAIWPSTSMLLITGYLFGWPGMNARTFLAPAKVCGSTSTVTLVTAVGRFLTGAFLLWIVARFSVGTSTTMAAWIGMAGMVLILHFGLFDILGWFWRKAGVVAPRLMNRPARSTSVAEFWGRRWNLAFHELAQTFVFRPLRARVGQHAALCAVFITSGLIHELVISVPARGGYGLPTAYFVFQAAALLFERSKAGRRLGLGPGWRGRIYTILVLALPAFWLFHPQFLQTVILPFMDAIGAL